MPGRTRRARRQGRAVRRACATRATRSSTRERYDAAGADEIALLDITASHEGRGTLLDVVARDGRRHLRAAHGRRRRARGGRRARAARRRRRQGEHQHGGGEDARARAALQRRVGRAGHRRGHRREAEGRRRAAGRSSSTAGAQPPGSTPSDGPSRSCALGAGEILLTSMDRDGTLSGYDLALDARRVRRRARARHRERRASARSRTCAPAWSRAARARSSRRRIFHDGTHTVAEAKRVPGARRRSRASGRRRERAA